MSYEPWGPPEQAPPPGSYPPAPSGAQPPTPPGGGPPGPPGPPRLPPPPPRPGGNKLLIIGLAGGLVLVLLATIGAVSWLSPSAPGAATGSARSSPSTPSSSRATAPPSAAAPTGSASRSPTAAQPTSQLTSNPPTTSASPSARTPPERPNPVSGLKLNSLYKVDLSGSGSCKARVRRPKPPVKNSALAPYLRTVVSCLVNAFRAPLAKQGFTLATPKIKTFKGSVSTPCGRLGSTSNPAFYCAGTIYWPVSSDDGREAYTFARLGYVGLVAHEFGHHLQATTGMLTSYSARYSGASSKERLALSRRLELQAQCFEGVFLSHDKSALTVTSRDLSEIRTWHSYTGDEDPPSSRRRDHGTSKEQYSWLQRGYSGADFGRCNTWTASSKSVS